MIGILHSVLVVELLHHREKNLLIEKHPLYVYSGCFVSTLLQNLFLFPPLSFLVLVLELVRLVLLPEP